MIGQQVDKTTGIIHSKFNTFSNGINILKNSKEVQIYTKILQKQEYLKNFLDYQNNDRNVALKYEETGLNSLYLNTLTTKYLMSDLFFNKSLNSLSNMSDKQFFLINPKLFSKYITNQLNRITALKRSSFKSNLNSGILKFSYQLLRRFQENIIGLKIICSGK